MKIRYTRKRGRMTERVEISIGFLCYLIGQWFAGLFRKLLFWRRDAKSDKGREGSSPPWLQ